MPAAETAAQAAAPRALPTRVKKKPTREVRLRSPWHLFWAAQPTLDVLRRLALALRVSTDVLVFDQDERGPDDELRLQFEALKALDPEEKKVVRSVLESILIKHDAKRWMGAGR